LVKNDIERIGFIISNRKMKRRSFIKRTSLSTASVMMPLSLTGRILFKPLPEVLIIGDSISIGYTPFVKQILGGIAGVYHNPGNGRYTGFGLEKIEEWLGDESWDVIHFNWGLWDLCYRSNIDNQGNKDKINGTLTHTLEEYRENLEKLVSRLRQTGARLIFATTTPVPEGEPGRIAGDEIKYNKVALEVMSKYQVPINDLHSWIFPKMDKYQKAPGDVHFTEEGYRYLARRVSQMIMQALE